MRKIRNPRYAPESLERKLSPTAFLGGLNVPTQMATMTAGADPTTLPGTGDPSGDPDPIGTGTGPSGPA